MNTVSEASVLLEARGIKKSYWKEKTEIKVIRGVDLSIFEGEKIGIIGASGVGKSTLLHILGTLESPSEGSILFGSDKQNLFKLSERNLASFRNQVLGFVFQFHYLLPEFTALENVMMPAMIAGYTLNPARKQAKELLEFVGLGHRLEHRPAELSGGEQQRVAIARAIILRPKVLLADELTGNLDSVNRNIVMDLLVQLNQETGIGIVERRCDSLSASLS